MSLSEKIEIRILADFRDCMETDEVVKVEDVKEFIKLIVEGWASTHDMPEKLFMQLQEQLKQHAGDKLI